MARLLMRSAGTVSKQTFDGMFRPNLVTPPWEQTAGALPPLTFKNLMDYYVGWPVVRTAVDQMVAHTVGDGIFVNGASESKVKLVEDFNDAANVDEWLQYMATELFYAGNHIMYRVTDWANPPELTSLAVPIQYVNRLTRTKEGDLIKIIMYIGGVEQDIPASDVWHFAFNPVSRGAFGMGILHALATPRRDLQGQVVPPTLMTMAQVENDMRKVINRYMPRYMVNVDAGDDVLEQKVIPAWEKVKSGQDFVNNFPKVEVSEIGLNARGQVLQSFLEYFVNATNIGLETPFMRLLTEPSSLSDASAVLKAYEPFRLRMQRFIKRRYEKFIIVPLLRANNMAWKTGDVEVDFDQPENPDPTLADLGNLLDKGALDEIEVREQLRTWGWKLMTDEEREAAQQARVDKATKQNPPPQAADQSSQRPLSSAQQAGGGAPKAGEPTQKGKGEDGPIDVEQRLKDADQQ